MAEPQIKVTAKCKAICPHFVVPVATAEHYRDVLGFQIMGHWLDPPVFAIVARDDIEIQFGKSDNGALPSPNIVRRESSLDAYIWVNDLDALYAELQGEARKSSSLPRYASTNVMNCWSKITSVFASAFRWIPVRFRVEIQQAQDPGESNGKHAGVVK
jgi:hypothetical protein